MADAGGIGGNRTPATNTRLASKALKKVTLPEEWYRV